MSGQFLRRKHRCDLPAGEGTPGDVWQCDCGRRWTLRFDWLDWLSGGHRWKRRLWPWPRRAPQLTSEDM